LPSLHYRLYGLMLASARPLPALEEASPQAPVDLYLHWPDDLERPPTRLELWQALPHISGVPVATQIFGAEIFYRLLYHSPNGTQIEFITNATGTHLWINWNEHAWLEGVISGLIGQVMGKILRLRRVTCLHASVIAVDGQAIALVGAKGAGKSTSAAGLAALGCAILSDDLAVLFKETNQYWAQPGYPRLRLWPEAARQLHPHADDLQRVFLLWDRRYIELTPNADSPWRFQATPLPLAAVYVLSPLEESLASPTLTSLTGALALSTLIENLFPAIQVDAHLRQQDFEILGELAKNLPVRHVARPNNLGQLEHVCRAIVEDARHITHVQRHAV